MYGSGEMHANLDFRGEPRFLGRRVSFLFWLSQWFLAASLPTSHVHIRQNHFICMLAYFALLISVYSTDD